MRHDTPRSAEPDRPDTATGAADALPPSAEKPVAWRDLPRKDQLTITLARFSEPLVQTSLQAYMFYQFKWFDPALPDAAVASQAGILHDSFTAAQFATALLWGRVADSRRAGRKPVLLIGLLGAAASSLGFGFASSFWPALVFRTFGSMTNGNVGVMRTMISEIISEKRFQPRAFLLPMTFSIGVIVGPILGGVLSDPASSYPGLLGRVALLMRFPYALPNVVSALFLLAAAAAVWLGLEETLEPLRDDPPDVGLRLGRRLAALLRARLPTGPPRGYEAGRVSYSSTSSDLPAAAPPVKRPRRQRLPFGRIFTRNVSLTMLAHFLLAFHVGTFNSMWLVFLSTPVWDPASSRHPLRLPFAFTGGLGLQSQSVGLAMAVLGAIGISMQLFLYSGLSARLGALRAWRGALLFFPAAYFLMPYLSVVPSAAIWLAICAVLLIQVTGRTFTLPTQIILVNNCSPHPSVLGTVHGLGQSVSSAARTVGPLIGGVVYGLGLSRGVVGLIWWALSGIAVCACLASLLIREGDGHEIWLESGGEQREEEEAPLANR